MSTHADFYEKIKAYGENETIRRFHMPGHKGKTVYFGTDIAKYDVTETDKTDNLFFPQAELKEAEERAARLFGVKKTVFTAGGATAGNQTALSFFAGRKVLFERNVHISALNAAMLLDITPVFVYNEFDCSTGVVLPVTASAVKAGLDEEKDIAAVFLTSPNYYGLCADLTKIKKVCEERNVMLIVDNSHGAHLVFFENAPGMTVYGSHCADITVDSAHKTLPALTGAAMIHFNYEISREEICAHMLAFVSTSPSFLILSSLDFACSWCERNKDRFMPAKLRTDELRSALEKSGIITVKSAISDPLRICIAAGNAEEINAMLQDKGIIPEMQSGNCIVFMISPFNEEDDFYALESAFMTIKTDEPHQCDKAFPKAKIVCPQKKAFFSPTIETSVESSVGMTAARAVIPYPPGVPILIPGETITRETAEYLIANNTEKVTVCEI